MRKGSAYFLKEIDTWVSHGILFLALGFMLHDSLYFEVDRRILMLIMLCQWSVLSLLFSYCVTYKKMRSLLFSATVMTFVGMIGIIGLKTYLPLYV